MTRGDADTGWSALYLCEAIMRGLTDIWDVVYDGATSIGWSSVMDPMVAPTWALQWLSYMVGVELPASATYDQMRIIIANQQGMQRGTVAYLLAAVQQTLTGSATVSIAERDTSPYHATVFTYEAQTVDPAATRAAIDANKPMGLIIAHTILSGATYAELEAHSADYLAFEAVFPTYEDARTYVPGA